MEDTQQKLQKIKRLMGKDAKKYTDEELLESEDTLRSLVDIIIDMYMEATPDERKKWHKK